MAQQNINIGTFANDGTGDTYRDAFDKVNDNFDEVYPLAENALSKTLLTPQEVTGQVDFIGGLLVDGVIVKEPTSRVVVNLLTDFPTPISNVITLNDNTQYQIGVSLNLGINELVMGNNCSVSGIESVVVTLTYTGVGDMFTITNKKVRISNVNISCINGRVVNFSDNTDAIFRMNDCAVSCAVFGSFNSSGASGSTARFTNVSLSSVTASGNTITGDWNTWLWEISATNITAGIMFNFGTATFDEIILDLNLINLGAGTTFISGLAASANINTGGTAIITRSLTSGSGALLTGVTVEDALWQFLHNDNIADSRTDGLLSLSGNLTETIILAIDTPAKVAGTWVVERDSRMTGDITGRLTYDDGRPAPLPFDGPVTALMASGGSKTITIYLGVNGVFIPESAATMSVTASISGRASCIWQQILDTAEYVELFVANNSDTTNIIITDSVLRVN